MFLRQSPFSSLFIGSLFLPSLLSGLEIDLGSGGNGQVSWRVKSSSLAGLDVSLLIMFQKDSQYFFSVTLLYKIGFPILEKGQRKGLLLE